MARAELIQVIRTTSCEGKGTTESPLRTVVEFWTPDGMLLATRDEWKESHETPQAS